MVVWVVTLSSISVFVIIYLQVKYACFFMVNAKNSDLGVIEGDTAAHVGFIGRDIREHELIDPCTHHRWTA